MDKYITNPYIEAIRQERFEAIRDGVLLALLLLALAGVAWWISPQDFIL
jgi:hypothetical protein